MKFLIVLCMCAGLSVAQQLPNYFQGSFQVPNAPIPAPGGASPYGGAAPAAPSPASWAQPQAPAYAAAARSQWSPAAASGQYSPAAPAYAGSVPSAPAAAPVSSVPSQYGWNVQHSSPAPQPQAAPAAQYAQPQQYAAPQPQYSPAQYAQAQARAVAPQSYQAPAQYAPQAAAPVATNPVNAALLRPASVHYANIGESLNGDYKFGYKTGNGDSFREETRAPDGTVQGQYGFVDADGKERIVKYSAGVNGFQVLNDGAAPAPAAAARAPAQQWAPPQAAAPQQWGQPQAAAPQQWGAQPAAPAPQQQWG